VFYKTLAKFWKFLNSNLHWHILWLAHDKFMLGICGLVVNQQGEILLLRHRFWKEGSWGLPSGYAKKREKVEDTLIRELREETGYEISDIRLFEVIGGYKLRLEIILTGRLSGGIQRLDTSEVMEARFFPLNDLPETLLESHKHFVKKAVMQGLFK
jgi:ADP-ribose pyrophosphatase YjhB (NUDIX family)